MKICKKCKEKYSDESVTCNNCGSVLEDFIEVSIEKYNKIRLATVILSIINVISIIVIVFLIANGSGMNAKKENNEIKHTMDNNEKITFEVADKETKETTENKVEETTVEEIMENKIKMPNLVGVEKNIGEVNLLNNGLIPTYIEEYSDYVEEGNIIRTEPTGDTEVVNNQNVVVYVSKGPSVLYPLSGNINWENSDGSWNDEYFFTGARIENGVMYLSVSNCDIEQQPIYVSGVAASNDINFSTYTSVTISNLVYESKQYDTYYIKKINYGYDIAIPLDKLNVNKPSNMYVVVHYDDGDEWTTDVNVMLSFSFVW